MKILKNNDYSNLNNFASSNNYTLSTTISDNYYYDSYDSTSTTNVAGYTYSEQFNTLEDKIKVIYMILIELLSTNSDLADSIIPKLGKEDIKELLDSILLFEGNDELKAKLKMTLELYDV